MFWNRIVSTSVYMSQLLLLKNQHEICICLRGTLFECCDDRTKTERSGKRKYQLCSPQSSLYIFLIKFYYGVVFWTKICLWMLTVMYIYICTCFVKTIVRGYDWYNTQAALTDCCNVLDFLVKKLYPAMSFELWVSIYSCTYLFRRLIKYILFCMALRVHIFVWSRIGRIFTS